MINVTSLGHLQVSSVAPAIPAPSTLGQVPRCCSECSPAREPCSAGRPKGFPCGKGISLGHPQDAGKVVDVACGVSACSAFLEGWVVSALPSWVGGARGVNSVAFGEVGEGPTRSSSSGVWGVCCLHGALLLGAQDWGTLVSWEVHF